MMLLYWMMKVDYSKLKESWTSWQMASLDVRTCLGRQRIQKKKEASYESIPNTMFVAI